MKSKFRVLTFSSLLVAGLAASSIAQAQIYWRVDTGYSQSTGADIKDKNFAADGQICGDSLCNTPGKLKDVGKTYILGGGLGMRFAPTFRGDVTVGYRSYKLDADDQLPERFKADVKSLNVMANGYYDFSAMSGWSPYLGAGLGLAQNKIGDGTFSGSFAGVPFSGTFKGGTKTGLAYSLTAGVSYPMSKAVTLDLGLRYIDLGKLETASGNATTTVVGFGTVVLPYSGATGKLKATELTAGLRF